jgi:hypothetical protein
MFPIRDMNSITVQKGETVVGPKGFYLLEKKMDISRFGTFRFWRGSKIFKVFSGDFCGPESRVDLEGSELYQFIGERREWITARAELEVFFNNWLQRWFFRMVGVESGQQQEDKGCLRIFGGA